MPHRLYDLAFAGIAEGQDPEQAKAAFAKLFGVSQDKVEQIFNAGRKTILKSKVDFTTAEKYIARLASIGIILSKHPIEASLTDAAALTLAPAAAPRPDHATPAPTVTENSFSSAPPTSAQGTADASSQPPRRIAFEFTGRGFEYFKIWIVNILLSIVTLGIYSAWAKVRNKQYFYGNTSLDATRFEYTAQPLKILKGRLIAVAFYIAYSMSAHVSPILSLVLGLLLMLFMPWIIVNSLKFNARHTSYRNINFRFVGSIGGAIKYYMLWPMLGMLSLGILLPFAWKKQANYVTSNHLYGSTPFSFDVSAKAYYKMLLMLLAGTVVFFLAMFVYFKMYAGLTMTGLGHKPSLSALIPIGIAYMAFYLSLGAYFMVSMANIHFNNTQLQTHRFASNWTTPGYAWLLFTNTLGILCTLGLFIPFAKVRTAAYKAAHTSLLVSGDLEGFISAEKEQSHALAEGVHDIFDLDISW